MKWEVRKIKDKWGTFLIQKYCKTDEPVCYGVSINKSTALAMTDRLNNPIYVQYSKTTALPREYQCSLWFSISNGYF